MSDLSNRRTSDDRYKCGSHFKQGKLIVFDRRRIVVAKPWPEWRAWSKTPTRPWASTRKWAERHITAQLHFPQPEQPSRESVAARRPDDFQKAWDLECKWHAVLLREHQTRARFFSSIPERERALAVTLHSRRWHLLSLLARCRGASDLAEGNMALAFALASNWVFHRPAVTQPLRAARSLVRRKQVEILRWLGFPGSESVRRILAKIEPGALRIAPLLYLRDALHDPVVVKWLAHLPQINAAVLPLISTPAQRHLLSPALLQEVTAAWQRGEREWTWGLLEELRQLESRLGVRRGPVQSLDLLRNHLYRLRRLGEYDRIDFPAPPFTGTPHVVPIRTMLELLKEGEEMAHCVVNYAREVLSGKGYFYRVLYPVRATLAIVKGEDGRWRPSDIRGFHNSRINFPMLEAIVASLRTTRA